MKLINKRRNVLVGFLLLILSFYYVNSSMFYHQHVVSGETIFHSHFSSAQHTDSSSDDGGHSLSVVKLIAALNSISFEEQIPQAHITPAVSEVEAVALTRPTAQTTFFLARTRSLRAPPCM